MTVKVLFFAHLKEILKRSEQAIELEEGTTVETASRQLLEGREGLANIPFAFAVNEKFVNAQYTLKDQDVLALLPPVSGG
jgi:sulfur-carrier protein